MEGILAATKSYFKCVGFVPLKFIRVNTFYFKRMGLTGKKLLQNQLAWTSRFMSHQLNFITSIWVCPSSKELLPLVQHKFLPLSPDSLSRRVIPGERGRRGWGSTRRPVSQSQPFGDAGIFTVTDFMEAHKTKLSMW